MESILKEVVKTEEIKDVVIVGAGFIGIEMMEAMKNQGKNLRVTMIGMYSMWLQI